MLKQINFFNNFQLNNKNKVLIIIIGAGAGLITYYTIENYLKLRKYRHIPGPKSRGLFGFFTGNYLDFIETKEKGLTFGDLLLDCAVKYGSVFKLNIFGKVLVCVNQEDAIKEVLIDRDFPKHEVLYKSLSYPLNKRCLGNGLVTELDKEKWKEKRSLLNHGFHRNFLKECVDDFNVKSNVLMEKLRSKADGKTLITMFNEINRLSLDVIASVAFGINSDSINNPNNELNLLVNKMLAGLNDILLDPLVQFRPSKRKIIKEFKEAVAKLRDYSRDHIVKRFKALEDKDYVPNDVLSIIINMSDKLDIDELVDEFLTFFIAGQETTANSLAFCILELGRNPEALEKLKYEVDNVLGDRNQINYEDITKLEYTGCVFKEALRKWPPAPEFSRKASADVVINGVLIPKNTWVAVSPYVSGRDSKYFPEPESFIPERFLKDSEFSKKNKFSLGPRNCIGQNFAKIEAKMFLAKFVQNFDFKLDLDQSFLPTELITLRPADGCKIYLTIRNK